MLVFSEQMKTLKITKIGLSMNGQSPGNFAGIKSAQTDIYVKVLIGDSNHA